MFARLWGLSSKDMCLAYGFTGDQPDGVERVEELVHFAVALWLVQTTRGVKLG